MNKHRKLCIALASLLAVLAVGCLLVVSQCKDANTVATISESTGEQISGKPRIVKLNESTAPDKNKDDTDDTGAEVNDSISSTQDSGEPAEGMPFDMPQEELPTHEPPNLTQHDSSPEEPAKHWVVDYKQVWVEDSPAWDEQIPVYSQVEESVCNVCGAVVTGNEAAHGKTHMMAGEGSGHHTEYVDALVGYDTVHHDASGHWETVEDGGHWE